MLCDRQLDNCRQCLLAVLARALGFLVGLLLRAALLPILASLLAVLLPTVCLLLLLGLLLGLLGLLLGALLGPFGRDLILALLLLIIFDHSLDHLPKLDLGEAVPLGVIR